MFKDTVENAEFQCIQMDYVQTWNMSNFLFHSSKVEHTDSFVISDWHIMELSSPLCWQFKSAGTQTVVKQMKESKRLKTAVLSWRETNGFLRGESSCAVKPRGAGLRHANQVQSQTNIGGSRNTTKNTWSNLFCCLNALVHQLSGPQEGLCTIKKLYHISRRDSYLPAHI